jgi:NADH-quinone oxidoreductase subunit M
VFALCVGFGIIAGVAYVWRAMQKAFFSGNTDAPPPHDHEPLPPISLPERLGAILLIGASATVGLFPQILLNVITPALNGPLFSGLRNIGRWP